MAKITKAMRDYLAEIGSKGGTKAAGKAIKALNANLTPEERKRASKRALRARWGQRKENRERLP